MSSTYSNLKIQLMATGENSTTWGNVTNVNLGTALEEAITSSSDVTFASGNVTLTWTDTNASQSARNMRLRCTGTTGGSTRNLVVPTFNKVYIVQNDCADSVLVKTSAGTGITVPAGKTTWVYVDGTNVVDAVTWVTSLTTSGNVSVGGNASVGANLAVTGNVTIGGSATITGNVSFSNLADGTVIVASGTVGANTAGYRGLPVSASTTTLALSDQGKFLTVSANVAIPANGTTAFPVGSAVVVYNNSASSISITITSDTLRLAGTATTGARVVAKYGVASLLKVATTTWVCSGAGVS